MKSILVPVSATLSIETLHIANLSLITKWSSTKQHYFIYKQLPNETDKENYK